MWGPFRIQARKSIKLNLWLFIVRFFFHFPLYGRFNTCICVLRRFLLILCIARNSECSEWWFISTFEPFIRVSKLALSYGSSLHYCRCVGYAWKWFRHPTTVSTMATYSDLGELGMHCRTDSRTLKFLSSHIAFPSRWSDANIHSIIHFYAMHCTSDSTMAKVVQRALILLGWNDSLQ